jgi:two-component system CheB/CheR fusion protein
MVKSQPRRRIRRRHTRIEDVRSKIRDKIAVAELAHDLAHELAHQLNNPLEALTNLIYLARKKAPDSETKNMLEEAESQLERVAAVVHSIIGLDKSDSDQRLRTAGTLLDAETFRRIKDKYESALHLASIVEGAADAIYSKKLDGTIMAWNPGAERLFGYGANEALGKSVRMLIPPDLANEEREILETVKAGMRVAHYGTRRKTSQGRDVYVSVSISPIRNASGRVVGASTIAREITPKNPV